MRSSFLACSLLVLSSLVVWPARAEPTEEQKTEASAHFQRGVQFYRERDFRNALIEFKKAHQIVPDYRVLFNLGQTSFELKDYVEAQHAFSAYLEQGGDEVSAARRKEVQGELAKLETYVAHLDLSANVEGAEVAVDGVVVGVTPLPGPLLVSAGRRKVEVQKRGYAPLERYVDVAGGATEVAAFELQSLQVDPLPPPPPPAPEPLPPPEVGHHAPFWALFGITLGLGTATGVMGGLALAAKDDQEEELATFPNTKERLDHARDKVLRYAIATDALAGLTGALAITTTIVGILDYADSGSDDEEEDPSDEAVGVYLTPTGMGLAGRF